VVQENAVLGWKENRGCVSRMSTAAKWEMSMFGHTIGILKAVCRTIGAVDDNIMRHIQQIIFRDGKFNDFQIIVLD
jgi:hypothetical protein